MKFTKFMDKYGWPTLNTGAAVIGSLYGGPLGAAATVGTSKMVQGFTSPKKKKEYHSNPLKSTAKDVGSVAMAYLGGTMSGGGLKSSEAVANGAGSGMSSAGSSMAGSAGSSGGKVISTVGKDVATNTAKNAGTQSAVNSGTAVSTSKVVSTSNTGDSVGKMLWKTPKGSYGKSFDTAGSEFAKVGNYVPPSSSAKELGTKSTQNWNTTISKYRSSGNPSRNVNDVINGGTGLKTTDVGGKVPGGNTNPPMSRIERNDQIMKYMNYANTATQVGMSIKGIHDLRNMEAPTVGAVPTIQPRVVEDTVSSQKRAQEENIETALANKRRVDLATGRADSSEDAILEMTAMNQLSGNVEKLRTDRENRIADEQFRADSQNQSLAANALMASAQMKAGFEQMRTGMESQLVGTLMSTPSQFMNAKLAMDKTYSDRYDSLMRRYATTTDPTEREYIKKRLEELDKLYK